MLREAGWVCSQHLLLYIIERQSFDKFYALDLHTNTAARNGHREVVDLDVVDTANRRFMPAFPSTKKDRVLREQSSVTVRASPPSNLQLLCLEVSSPPINNPSMCMTFIKCFFKKFFDPCSVAENVWRPNYGNLLQP